MDSHKALFSTSAMDGIFSGEGCLRAILAFEAGLARALARAGVIPSDAASAIATACETMPLDVTTLHTNAAVAGTLAIPLVKQLTAFVGGDHGRHVHFGATSQDALDTAMMLQSRAGLGLLIDELLALGAAAATLAERHRRTQMAGRTLLQQALPITFGLKAARWLALACRQARRLDALRSTTLVVQFGGAVGTLSALGDAGPIVTELLAEDLGLNVPDLPWHTERDRVAEIAAAVGVVAGSMAKIATDLVLLAQNEVGEVSEGLVAGKGGSSAMPHKRNPVDATFAIASTRLALGAVPVVLNALPHEHERGVGGWQAEWSAIPDLFRHTAGSVARTRGALEGLEVDAERMRANLDLSGGLLMAEALTVALARAVGRPDAFQIVESATNRARERGQSLRDVALADPRVRSALSPAEIEQALDPAAYLGSADLFIDRALEGYRALRTQAPTFPPAAPRSRR